MKDGDVVLAEISIIIPEDASEVDVVEWIEYNTGFRGDIRMDNPLALWDMEAQGIRVQL